MTTTDIEPEAVHGWFGLSYANYSVLPRTLLQSMPDEWQSRFVACMRELQDAFRHVPQAEVYEAHAATEHIVGDMTDQEMRAAGITEDWYAGEEPPQGLSEDDLAEWQREHEQDEPTHSDRDGNELQAGQRVLVPVADPVPHYNRGRTRIEPLAREDA